MTQLCTTNDLSQHSDRLDFFQQMILSGLRYWQEHPAVQEADETVLDIERDAILKALARGLEFDPAWPLARMLIVKLAPFMERRGYWTTWRAVLENAILTAQRVNDVDGETTVTALLARLSQRQSRGEDVVRYYRRAMRLAKQSENQYEFARACCNLGYYYIDADRWWRSEVLSLRALEIFEELESDHGRAHTHNHLGVLYTQQQRFEEAESHLQAAYSLWQAMNDDNGMIHGLLNLGQLFTRMGRHSDAIDWLKQAEEKCKLSPDKSARANICISIGNSYRELNDYDTAIVYTLQAEKLFQTLGNQLGLAYVQNDLGLIYSKNGSGKDVMIFFTNALAQFRNIGNTRGELDVLANIIELQIERDELQDATIYFKELKNAFQKYPILLHDGNVALLRKYHEQLASRE